MALVEEGRTQIAEVRSGGSYLSHSDSRLHFGLGDQPRVKRLEVSWPSGLRETLESPPVDRFLVLREGKGLVGSWSTTDSRR